MIDWIKSTLFVCAVVGLPIFGIHSCQQSEWFQAGERDAGAPVVQALGQRGADAAGGAGDQDPTAGQRRVGAGSLLVHVTRR